MSKCYTTSLKYVEIIVSTITQRIKPKIKIATVMISTNQKYVLIYMLYNQRRKNHQRKFECFFDFFIINYRMVPIKLGRHWTNLKSRLHVV